MTPKLNDTAQNCLKTQPETPIQLMVCSAHETLQYWPMSNNIMKGPPTDFIFSLTAKGEQVAIYMKFACRLNMSLNYFTFSNSLQIMKHLILAGYLSNMKTMG